MIWLFWLVGFIFFAIIYLFIGALMTIVKRSDNDYDNIISKGEGFDSNGGRKDNKSNS